MERALVVVDDSDAHRELLAEAGQLARGVGAELVLFSWVTPGEYDEDAETMEAMETAEHASYSGTDPLDVARNFARTLADDVLGDEAPEFDVTAAVAEDGKLSDEILDAANREESDHVFVVGRRRSPTGKVIFGDVAQRIILNFDGPVTVMMD